MSDNVTPNHIDEAYAKYADMLYRIALSHLANPSDAEDAVHDVFYKYITKHKHFNDEEHRKAWLIKVLVNRCYDELRKNKYRDTLNDIDFENIAIENETASVNYENIMTVLNDLDPKYKTVVILYYLEELSIKEISKTLMLTSSAVKMRLQRARQMIQAKVTKE